MRAQYCFLILFAMPAVAWAQSPLHRYLQTHSTCVVITLILLVLFSVLFFWSGQQRQRRRTFERALNANTALTESMLNALP